MTGSINKDKIIDFIFDELPLEEVSLVVDAIISNESLKKTYEEEKEKILTHCYVDNALSPDKRIEFEDRLKTDKQLPKEVKLQKEINSSIENLNLKETLDQAYESYISRKEHSISTAVRTYSININLKNWLIAASIALLFIVGGGITYHFQTRDSLENRLYASYYEPFNKIDNYVTNSSGLNLAQQKYLKGDYMNAFLLFDKLPASLTIESEKHFYKGLSLMELDRFDKAIENFEYLFECKDYFEGAPQVYWYLALCHLKLGNNQKAIELFETIVKTNGYNYRKAKRILKKLG
ncbi:MAG TPA: hypothetical protein DCG75_10750 [Bacteroidales bacterium]|nr:hypothetical protein [Bacteroidales bacterium]